jgi:hypothetical protein
MLSQMPTFRRQTVFPSSGQVWGMTKNADFYTEWAQKTLHYQNDTENKCGEFRTSHLHQSIEKSQSFVHSSQRLDMRSASPTADVETTIQLVPNFVQSVPSDGSYSSCDSLPQLWQRSRQRRDRHFIFHVAPQEEVARSSIWRFRRSSAPHDVTGPCTTDPSPGKVRVQVVPNIHVEVRGGAPSCWKIKSLESSCN